LPHDESAENSANAREAGEPGFERVELVHEQFERHARETPHAVAARCGRETLAYGELNRRANRLAHELIELGVGAGNFVVVCVEPSLDVLVALLGVLKAGAAYVPVDPGYPAARIRTLLEDTRPAAVVTQARLASRLEPGAAALLLIDRLPEAPDSAEDPRDRVLEQSPAYVFYTSGTTGTPKGVVASHANLRHYVGVARERYQFGARDVMPAIARFSFSISLCE
jgi:non-ribosomal peptide synthetase component F